uniref:Pectinesterase inhibitor domain-containing protein n=1 Tax=Brassica oleracea var. oleracea TaxID=109376 RepID=A0A0D3A5K1_BRAOL
MMVTKGEIESICNKKYVDSTLCFEVLKPNPTIAKLDFTGLANFLINYTSRNVSDVLKEIKLYEGNTTDLQTIKLCEELYDLSLFSDDHALKALAARDYDSVNFKVGGTLENMVTCNEELSTMKPVPQSLIAKNNVIKNLSGIVLTILECFIRKEDEIESICNRKDVDSTLYFEVLKPNPKLDFIGLAIFLINYTSRNVSDTLKQLKLYESNTTDWQTIKLCKEMYESSLYRDDFALKALAAKDYDTVNINAGVASDNMITCNEELSTLKPVPQSLITKNTVIENLSNIVLTILECFIRKESRLCSH